jgi:putative SOS response-associated peptidase YedK
VHTFDYTDLMCGRFTLSQAKPALVEDLGCLEGGDLIQLSYNFAPGQSLPAITRSSRGDLRVVNPLWGLVPSWFAGSGSAQPQVNARVETARDKPSFRRAWASGRCLILADGYFEWPPLQGPRHAIGHEPFYVSLPKHQPFFMAGLCTDSPFVEQDSLEGGKPTLTAAILTTAARPELEWLHPRMPLILEQGQAKAWLAGRQPSLWTGSLLTRQVSSYVNNVAHQGPRCIEKRLGLFD